MTDDEFKLEVLKLITSAEHHFNNLTFNVRALASTWLLATIAGTGWILKDLPSNADNPGSLVDAGLLVDKSDLLLVLCVGGSIGIFVLWILDIRVYQQMTNVWFDCRKKYESSNVFPTIRNDMKDLFKTGRATELIIIYYLALTAAPLVMAMLIAHWADNSTAMFCIGGFLLLIVSAIYLYSPKDQEWMQEKLKKK